MSTEVNNPTELRYGKRLIELRRNKVLELNSKGYSQQRIAEILNVSQPLISLDLQYLTCQAQTNLQDHITVRIPTMYQRVESGLNQVLEKLWDIADNSKDNKERLQSYGLIQNTYRYLQELSTNGVTFEQAVKWIEDRKKIQLTPAEEKQMEQVPASESESNVEEEEEEEDVTEKK